MMPVDAAITRVRRDLTLSTLLKSVLLVGVLACFVIGPDNMRVAALLGIGAIWFWLSLNSARSSRAAAQSPSLIAAGQFEEAEKNIEQTVRSFSIFRPVKLQALHHMALLRHAQRRWQESAALCRALLRQRLGILGSLNRSTRLLLADALLEMNDARGAYHAMTGLYRERLALPEMLHLLLIQLDYSARIGAWQPMMDGIMAKVQLAELMPTASAARAQALLALAAKRTGRDDFASWLKARAELLADVQKLAVERPLLRGLWSA